MMKGHETENKKAHTHFFAYSLTLRLPWWCATPTICARLALALLWVDSQASLSHLSTIASKQSILFAHHLGGAYELISL